MTVILKMCFAVLLALLVSNLSASVGSASVESASVESPKMLKRETQTDNQSETQTQAQTTQTTQKPINYCDPSLSCGWAVYTAFTREIRYFMKNSCECPELQHCVRVDDDPVISAFVYKCRPKRTTVPPTTTE